MPNNTKLKVSNKKTYRVYTYGDGNKWLGNVEVSGCKTVDECALKAIKHFGFNNSIKAISIMDTQVMQAVRYKVTFDNSKNGFALSE